jgi:hypothetical protein
MNGRWTYAQAVHPGSGKTRSQDACAAQVCGGVLIAVVADGAGSAAYADRGAQIVVQTFLESGLELLRGPEAAIEILEKIRLRVVDAARLLDSSPEEFSSTLVGAVLSPGNGVFLQVGDGAAVFSDGSGFRVAVEPETCEFVNATRFATGADAGSHARYIQLKSSILALALFSDGLQPLLLDATNEPHSPFFEAAFRTLRGEDTHDEPASTWIAETLASEPVIRRTDDDTSLMIARWVEA